MIKLGYLKAIVEYGMRHETLGDEFTEYMKELVKG
jgi:UTP--glucose-1-phosphate uridylyltransferase